MVNILDPKEGESIYDPACGTGGMLLEARRESGGTRVPAMRPSVGSQELRRLRIVRTIDFSKSISCRSNDPDELRADAVDFFRTKYKKQATRRVA
jgi:23S rRNA G2445 N2-methylase RlmL